MGDYCTLASNARFLRGATLGATAGDTLTVADAAACDAHAANIINGKLGKFSTTSVPPLIADLALMIASEWAIRMYISPTGSGRESGKSLADELKAEWKETLRQIKDGELAVIGDSTYGKTSKGDIMWSDNLDTAGRPKEPIFNQTGVDGIDRGIREDVDTDGESDYDTPG